MAQSVFHLQLSTPYTGPDVHYIGPVSELEILLISESNSAMSEYTSVDFSVVAPQDVFLAVKMNLSHITSMT